MRESLGTRLRRQRETQHVTLESLAAATKISSSLFQALERDDVTAWPSGIYRRAFIRTYAEAIGLDPDSVCREFLEQFPDPGAQPSDPLGLSTPMATHLNEWQRVLAGPNDPLDAVDELLEEARQVKSRTRRWRAVACDATGLLVVGCLAVALTGRLWMPVAVAVFCYHLVGTLLLGKSPSLWWIERRAADEGLREAPGLGHTASLP